MTEFTAEPGKLLEIAGRLRGLQEEFNDQKDILARWEGALGSPEVDAALQEFADNWSDQREEVSEMLQEVAGYVFLAGEGYRGNEQAISGHIDKSRAATMRKPAKT